MWKEKGRTEEVTFQIYLNAVAFYGLSPEQVVFGPAKTIEEQIKDWLDWYNEELLNPLANLNTH